MLAFTSRSVARQRRAVAGLSNLIAAGLLWGTGGLFGSLLGRAAGLSAVAVAAYRLAVGGTLIVLLIAVTGRQVPRGRAAWTRIIETGLLAALFQGCYFAAVSATSVSLATLVTIGASPVIVLIAESARGRRRINSTMAAVLCLALVGLSLLVGSPSGDAGPVQMLTGTGLAVAAAGGFATVTILGAQPIPGLDATTVTGFGFTVGAAVLIPVAATTTGLGFAPSPTAVGLLTALGVGPTALAYALYFRGLPRVSAATGAVIALLEPLTGTVLAVLLLGDRLGAAGFVGAGLLCIAVVLTAGTTRNSGSEFLSS